MTRLRPWMPWAIVSVFALVAVSFAQSAPGRHIARSLGVAESTRHYTVFAFTDVRALPYSARKQGRPTISVSITNHEGVSRVFTVSAEQRRVGALRSDVRVIVPNGETRQVDVRLSISCPNAAHSSTTRLDLTLSPSAKSLTHFVKCEPTR